jgi:hypothetical protein
MCELNIPKEINKETRKANQLKIPKQNTLTPK